MSGITAVLINNPIDVIKTRKQAEDKKLNLIIKDLCNKGLPEFYKGLIPRMSRFGLLQGLNFYLFDKFKNK